MPKLRTPSGEPPKLLNLNLVWDYPVRWSKYKVIRDLLQNFYDAVGPSEWHRRFRVRIEGQSLYLRAEQTGFSYEWLLHIGASTKREQPGNFAGHFGEGFKIAALCAARDFHWNVELASRTWALQVIHSNAQIEDKSVRMLAYRVWEGLQGHAHTELCLWPFDACDDGDVLQAALASFFYEENPLLGEKLWADATVAVYLRSDLAIPSSIPTTYQHEGPGVVFAARQALGSVRYPVVLAVHDFRQIDRERNALYGHQVTDIWRTIANRIEPSAAVKLLRMMSREWHGRSRNKYDSASYQAVITALLANVSRSPSITALFRKDYPNLVVAPRIHSGDVRARNRRRQALAWLRSLSVRHRLVQGDFSRLGYSTVEAACDAADGFAVVRDPSDAEQVAVQLLRDTAVRCFAALFDVDNLPPTRILRSDAGVWMGMALCVPTRSQAPGTRRYDLPYIALKRCLLRPGRGGEALSTYLHELGHMYGGDASARFSHLLTDVIRESIDHALQMKQFLQQWDAVCGALPRESPAKLQGNGSLP